MVITGWVWSWAHTYGEWDEDSSQDPAVIEQGMDLVLI
jgi:hypothetical protein